MIGIDEQIACVAREIALRKNVYPKFVSSGRMKQEAADQELARMEAVIETLNAVKAKDALARPIEPVAEGELLVRTALNPKAAWPFPKEK